MAIKSDGNFAPQGHTVLSDVVAQLADPIKIVWCVRKVFTSTGLGYPDLSLINNGGYTTP